MIRADVLASSPVYLTGLVQVLNNAGIAVLAARLAPHDGPPSVLADALVIDADSLGTQQNLDHITTVASYTPVLVVNTEPAGEPAPYLRAGAAGVIGRREPCDRIVTAIRALVAGTVVVPGSDLPPAPAGQPQGAEHGLSDREAQVLRHIARGLTHGQIATRLGISPHTVDTYVKRIRTKLGVGNKAELTRVALLGQPHTGEGSRAS